MIKFSQALNCILPDHCVLCQQSLETRTAHLLCSYCWAALPRNIFSCCHCALPLEQDGVCGACQINPLTKGLALSPLLYHDEAKGLIHELKFRTGLRAGKTLSALMLDNVDRLYQGKRLPECLIPVPLSYRRQISRGYNQAAWLSHCIGKQLGIPTDLQHIRRQHGPAQQNLARAQRLKLGVRSFKFSQPIPYQHVAIVDDVLTTGATCRAISRLLLLNGVARVDIWCATRSPG